MPMDMELRDYLARAIERGAIAHVRATRTSHPPENRAQLDVFISEIQKGAHRAHSYAEADEVIAELRLRGVPTDRPPAQIAAEKRDPHILANFIHGAITASDTPLPDFLADMAGPFELAEDILQWMQPAFDEAAQLAGDALPSCSRANPIGSDFFITQAESDRGECGFPPSTLSNAVQLWSCMQGPRVSVAQAARAFNCQPALIVDAVRAHHWMFLESPRGVLIDDPEREGAARDLAGDALPAAIDDYSAVFIGHEGE
jgi:hypothetical protein